MGAEVQIHAPYPYLCRDIDYLIKQRLNPEIYFSADNLDNIKITEAKELARILNQNKRTVTFHAPFRDLSPGGSDSKVRAITQERLLEVLRLARYFKPRVIVCHPGFNRWASPNSLAPWVSRSLETWQPIIRQAERQKTVLALENVYEDNPQPLLALLKGINSPWFNFCFDIGHFNIFSVGPLSSWFRVLAPRLVEVHLHDNMGKEDQHLPIGQGTANFAQLFLLLKKIEKPVLLAIEPIKKSHISTHLEGLARFVRE